MFKHRVGTYQLPAVVLVPFPEFEPVGSLPRKVECQAASPQRCQNGHYYQPGVHSAVGGYYPAVNKRQNAPYLIHLAVVAR